jgi:hypothetical protein
MSVIVGTVAAFFLWMGIVALARPARVLQIFGTAVTTADGRNEVRAVYGGYGIAMVGALLSTFAAPRLRPGIFFCLALAMLGMAAGRVCSIMIDRRAGFFPWLFMGTELVIAAALLAAWRLGS